MSKIDELIRQFCPDGVEYKQLRELVLPKENIKWKNISGKEYQYIDLSSVDRVTHRISDTLTVNAESAPSRAQQIVRTGDVIFGTTRPTLKRFCVINADFDGQVASTGFCVLRPNKRILTNFLFHLIGSSDFNDYVEANQKGASYPAISDAEVKNFKIPVPPIEVQREIVDILDKFTQLEAELEAELEARKKQYEYYRNQLLTFDDAVGVRWTTMADISRVSIGEFVHKNKQNPNGKYPVYNGGRSATGNYDHFNNDGNKIVISARGAYAGYVNMMAEPYWAGNSSYSIDIADRTNINWIYVYYYLKSSEQKFTDQQQKGGIPAVSKKQIEQFRIALPSTETQNRIVTILDKFDKLVNDISEGLPAELKARRQQYEYYRNKLLTFQELPA